VTGVSGSGKSTLSKNALPGFRENARTVIDESGKITNRIEKGIQTDHPKLEFVDQIQIGNPSRSNPVTYVKAYDPNSGPFADQIGTKQRGLQTTFLSFNVDGGRCENCFGEGITNSGNAVYGSIHLTCESVRQTV